MAKLQPVTDCSIYNYPSSSAAFVEQDDNAEEDDDVFSGLPEVIEGVKVDPQNPFATEAFLNTAYQMNSYRRNRQDREFPVRLEAWFERWVPAEDGSGAHGAAQLE